MPEPFAAIPQALEEVRAGRFLIVVDDEDRQNQGDFVIAAEKAAPDTFTFMLAQACGTIYVPMTGHRLDELGIGLVVSSQTDLRRMALCEPVDVRRGVTTGASAADRAATVRAMVDPATKPSDLVKPGHVFPLRAREGGVLVRTGHTEAAVDLARMAGLYPAAVICELMNPDGSMARLPELLELARKQGLRIVTIEELIRYRRQKEKLVRQVATTALPTRYGDFELVAYESVIDGTPYLAIVKGDVSGEEPVLVRVHSGCVTGEALFSLRCDCGEQIRRALQLIQEEGRGVLVYIHHQEGRGIGLLNKIRAYALRDQGKDTVEANELLGFPPDIRDYGLGTQVLTDLGVRRMRLLSNNPAKFAGIQGYGLEVVERVPLEIEPNPHDHDYLRTKKEKLGHLLTKTEESGREQDPGKVETSDNERTEGTT